MAGWSCVESCVTIGAAWVMGVVDGVDMGNFMGDGCTPSLVGGKRQFRREHPANIER